MTASPPKDRLRIAALFVAAAVIAAFLYWNATRYKRAVRYEKTVSAMGTFVTATAWSDDEALATAAIDDALETTSRLERLLSAFDPNSDISRLNGKSTGLNFSVARETHECLLLATRVSRETSGAFDITVGPLVALWKKAGQSGALPSARDIEAARERVSYKFISPLPGFSSVMISPGSRVQIDLAAVAKGFIMEKAAKAMKDRGVTSGFVNGGGDIRFIGSNPDGSPFRVGVADPRDETAVAVTLNVSSCAVVTSGNYEQFYEIAGKHYSHIIDPRTGWALEGAKTPASVTVVASDAGDADAWATALSVLGRDGADAAAKAGIEFLMFFVEGDDLVPFQSAGMAPYIKEPSK